VRGKDFQRILYRRPFRLFRITVSTGESFDVRHPDMAIVDRRFVAVGFPESGAAPEEDMVVIWIDLRHIVHLQRLQLERS
jgi:hypothetical protein